MIKLKNTSWVVGLIPATAASLCCITPLLAFLGGVGGLATAFSWMQPYRPYLVGLTIAVFAFAWYQKLKPAKQVNCNCETEARVPFRQSKKFLAIVTVIAALLVAFPYYGKTFYTKPVAAKGIPADTSRMVTVRLNIGGMDCEACTGHINSVLAGQYGVFEAHTSYENANAVIRFDSSKTTVNDLKNTIRSIGYTVTSSSTPGK